MMQHLLEHHGSKSLQRLSQTIQPITFFYFCLICGLSRPSVQTVELCSVWGVFLVFFTANFSRFISVKGVTSKVCISKGLVLQPFLSGEPTPSRGRLFRVRKTQDETINRHSTESCFCFTKALVA